MGTVNKTRLYAEVILWSILRLQNPPLERDIYFSCPGLCKTPLPGDCQPWGGWPGGLSREDTRGAWRSSAGCTALAFDSSMRGSVIHTELETCHRAPLSQQYSVKKQPKLSNNSATSQTCSQPVTAAQVSWREVVPDSGYACPGHLLHPWPSEFGDCLP